MSSVSAFILSFNHTQKLIECVHSLCAQSCITEILILDNQSTADLTETYAHIQRLSTPTQTITIHYSDHMMSFSEAQNWGLDQAKHDLVLLMNNDAYFETPETLHSSVQLLENNPKVGIVGHKILNLDGSLNHHGVFMNLGNWDATHFGSGKNPLHFKYSLIYNCVAVTGACMLVRRTPFRFDLTYWFGYEDVDFCFQYLQARYQILCNPHCVVFHEESSSRKSIQHADPLWLGKQTIGSHYFKEKWASFRMPLFFKSLPMNLLNGTAASPFLFRTHADILAIPLFIWALTLFYHLSFHSLWMGVRFILLWGCLYFLIRTILFLSLDFMALGWIRFQFLFKRHDGF